MLEHGGQLKAAAKHYNIALEDWLDLSTGISPWAYPIPAFPETLWHRLPETDDDLHLAASRYYDNISVLATSGTQAAIQTLPRLFKPGQVAILTPMYSEHAESWRAAGHEVQYFSNLDEALIFQAPVTVICNPNNPTAQHWDQDNLLHAAQNLQSRGGWLIVDEAYGDPYPNQSVTPIAGTSAAPQLITLRSLGKFFGLAGARVGFVVGHHTTLDQLANLFGPWPISGPARWIAQHALNNNTWQTQQCARIIDAGQRLKQIIECHLGNEASIEPTGLFSTCRFNDPRMANSLYIHLAQQGILTRLFKHEGFVRIGIPGDIYWQRLENAVRTWPRQITND